MELRVQFSGITQTIHRIISHRYTMLGMGGCGGSGTMLIPSPTPSSRIAEDQIPLWLPDADSSRPGCEYSEVSLKHI